jgi:hypothetical protein
MDTIKLDDERPPRGERKPSAKQRPPRRDTATSRDGDGDTGGTGATRSSRPRSRGNDKLILESLTGLYGMIGAGLAGVGQVQGNAGLLAAGVNVTIQGEELAQQWVALGDQVPAVRRALEGMLQTGAVSVVVMGNIGIVLPVLAAAGILPQQVGNMFLHPEAVEAGQAYQAMQAAAAAGANGGTPA